MKSRMNLTRIVLVLLALIGSMHTASAYYDPSVQRWVNRDPIGEQGFQVLQIAGATARVTNPTVQPTDLWINRDRFEEGGINLYRFVQNIPIILIDKNGLQVSIPTPIPCKDGCLSAPDLPSSSSDCGKYGDRIYHGISLSCFCSCAGDSDWSKAVRGCLRCMDDKGTPVGEAHEKCYKAADEKHSRPWVTLVKCALKCSR